MHTSERKIAFTIRSSKYCRYLIVHDDQDQKCRFEASPSDSSRIEDFRLPIVVDLLSLKVLSDEHLLWLFELAYLNSLMQKRVMVFVDSMMSFSQLQKLSCNNQLEIHLIQRHHMN